ncbi:MAG: glycosyltransferase, partial [Flavobacteriales bacterium]
YIQTGLFELEQQRIIDVKVVLSSKAHRGRIQVADYGKVSQTKQANPKVSYYTLINAKTGNKIRFACDLYDHADVFSEDALQSCDFYFKRSYEPRYISKLSEDYQKKIHPLGLAFGVKSPYAKNQAIFFYGLLLSNLGVNLKLDRLLFKRLMKTYKAQMKHWSFIKTTRSLTQFEAYNIPISKTVLFQTRCFPEKSEDVIKIHQQRYQIIKLLQQGFPKHFHGGFISSEIVSRKYQDALSDVPSAPQAYLEAMKQAGIVIYTRGLANSPAWKLAEYLSQGKVIIAEPLTTELVEPLQHGIHLLYFNTDDELVSHINTVLSDAVLFDTLSKNARHYFEMHVHPTKNIKRILDCMILNSKVSF